MNPQEKKLLFFTIMLGNALGLITFHIKLIEKGRHLEPLLQRFFIAIGWNIVLTAIILYTNYLLPLLDEINGLHPYTHISDSMKAAQCIFASLAVIGLWMYFLLRQNESMRIGNKFIKIDKSLEKCRHFYELKELKSNFCIAIIIFLIMWTIAVWMEWKMYTLYMKVMWHIWWHKHLFPQFVITVFMIQYKVVMIVMRSRMKSLNEGIVKLMNVSNEFDYKFSVNGKMLIDGSIVEDFEAIRNAYEELHTLSMEIGHFFAFPILIVLAYICYVVLCMVFFIGSQINMKLGGFFGNSSPALWLAIIIPLTVVLILEIEGLVEEFQCTPEKLFKLSRSFPKNKKLKSQVKYFTRELLHRKLQVTACGLFPLDSTFFLSVFSAVLTYLIIIFQLRGKPTLRKNLQKSTNTE